MIEQQTLIDLLRGKGAYADANACVDGVPFESAGRGVENFPRTIWQLVWHINYWMQYDLDRIAGKSPAYPEHAALSWPNQPAPSNQLEWEQAVSRFKDFLRQYDTLARADDATLSRKIALTNSPKGDQASTIAAALWQTVVHNGYHLGQIVMLRQMFGLWPPPIGSDTW